MSLCETLTRNYLKIHGTKEDCFWSTRMGLSSANPDLLETSEHEWKRYVTDAQHLTSIRRELEEGQLNHEDRIALEGWLRFFSTHAIEEETIKELQRTLLEKESALESARQGMKLGYSHPQRNEWIEQGSVGLSLMVMTAPKEEIRQAAYEGLRSIEKFVLDHGFLDIVKQRNQIAHGLGFSDYYDYKVQKAEGMSKNELFALLDDLEEQTRDTAEESVERLKQEKGESVYKPWNFSYFSAGDLTAKLDPYFPFESALEIWGRSFHGLGIKFANAQLRLDLVDRKGKYENGFMHGPVPTFTYKDRHKPARIHFTANAIPGKIGSGHRALTTLFHEGGHAAHFANIVMPAPCYSMEYAPTSVAFAETQSMFLDSLIGDTDWRMRYAKSLRGETIAPELLKAAKLLRHRFLANRLRSMLMVCYAEKALYEMSDGELSGDNVLATFRSIEQRFSCLEGSGRPILSIPHLLSSESSAYYHGYVLAQMAVYQTRNYFLERDGNLLDNPKIGPQLATSYWQPGNAKSFLELIPALTGQPFTAEATAKEVNATETGLEKAVAEAIEREKGLPASIPADQVDLETRIDIVHGDETITTNSNGQSFAEMSSDFAKWIGTLAAAQS